MFLPDEIIQIINALEAAGFEAFAVGGGVRDFLRGVSPHDFDITTNATPEQVCCVFSDFTVIKTGIKHGTVTVLIGKMPVEITTYRTDGKYSDGRHPDSVSFSENLVTDLSRRDFTMNAVCYNPRSGFTDIFGGRRDIESGIIRAIGSPVGRFREDALRILRALRFSSCFGYEIEEETSRAIFAEKELLLKISAERIASEFVKTLCGQNVRAVFEKYYPVFGAVIPEILPMAGFDQKSKYHIYDVLTHTLIATESAAPERVLRLAVFFHDIGKPNKFFTDENGVGHFFGHPDESERLTREILCRLKFDNDTKSKVLTLVKYHDVKIENTEKSVRRWLFRLSPELFFRLLDVKRADTLAHAPDCFPRLDMIADVEKTARKIIAERQCFSARDLKIDGHDVINAGITDGRKIGETLSRVLGLVISGELENDREILLEYIKSN